MYQRNPGPIAGTTHAGVGLQLLAEAGVRDLVHLFEEESQVVLPRMVAEGRRFDLAFIDGNHRSEAAFLDLVSVGRLVKEGGIVFVDDTQLPAIRRALEFCVGNLGWTSEDSGAEGDHHRWRVMRTGPREALARPITDLVDFGPTTWGCGGGTSRLLEEVRVGEVQDVVQEPDRA